MNELDKLRQEIQNLVTLAESIRSNDSIAAKLDSPEFKEKFKKIIGDGWDDPVKRHAIATYVTQMINNQVTQTDLTSIMPYSHFAPNEEMIYRKKGKLRAYYLPHGADALTTQYFNEEVRPVTNPIICAPSYDYDQFKNGRYGDMQEQSRGATQEFVGKKNKLIFDTLTASIGSGDENYVAAPYDGNITTNVKAAVNAAIDYVSENNSNPGGYIIGPYKYLAKFRDFEQSSSGYSTNLWTEEYKRKILATGLIDVYMGYPVIPVRQYKDGQGLFTIPDDEIFVIGADDWGRFFEKGPYDTLEDIDAIKRRWVINMKIDVGMYVWDSLSNYRIHVART